MQSLFTMRIFRKRLIFYILIALLSGNSAYKFPSDEDIPAQNVDFSQDDGFLDYRLPESVVPISYELLLMPKLQYSFFEGIVKIIALVKSNTDRITLNVGNIHVISQNVILKDGTKVYESHEYNNVTEKFTLILDRELKKGTEIIISMTYNGTLSDNMIGFYRSFYFDEAGQLKQLAATQFQATHARHAFPCFDEPSFKAKFLIRISRDKNYKCLSNMPLNKTEELNGTTWDTFVESVPMSTYLVAFTVSELDSLNKGANFRAWARSSVINETNYALTIGTEALEVLGKEFQQEYELPKMDMVAVPDFAAGAMENWGLVKYRETAMLYNENESSDLAQQRVASVVVHELTHMWFGNLVTPEWWGYLWLSEAFATYFQYFATANIEVTWNMREQFVVEEHQVGLMADGLESSLPMTRDVSSQSQIGGMGGAITYSKGASVVRMMNLIFGADVFKSALRSYLRDNKKEGIGRPNALWEALQRQIDKLTKLPMTVETIMNTWTTQPGYPVISVVINDTSLYVFQQRFLLRNLEKTPTNVTWCVPLTWTTQSNPNFGNTTPKYWLENKEAVIHVKVNPKEWVIFNLQSSGFYRVNYNSVGWQRIFNVLKSSKFDEIHVLNRAAIVDDLLNLARGKYQNYEIVLEGITYLKQETNYLPFKAALNGLAYLNKRFTGYKEHSLFKKYVLSLIEERREALGYEDRINDNRLTVLLRRELNNWACNFDEEKCITIYVKKFQKWKTNTTVSIKPNERTTAYCVGIRHGTSEDWEFLWQQYLKSNNAADQVVILNALGCSLNTTILEKYLNYSITSYRTNRIRKQDSASVFNAVYNSGLIGAEYVLDFVEKYHEDMKKYYGGQHMIAAILDRSSQRFSTAELVDKFESFIEKHKVKFAPILKSLESSLKIARYELIWYRDVLKPIIPWLRSYNEKNEDPNNYRLPKNINPLTYNITVAPYFDPGTFTFDGHVKIEAEVEQPTNQIVLHSAEITHHTVSVTVDEREVDIISKRAVKKYDFYIIELEKILEAKTKLIIEIAYTGHLNSSELRGFYKSSYVDEYKKLRWIAATHLEPVGARKLFPCFDEPARKAYFNIGVRSPPGYFAHSNMPLKNRTKEPNGHTFYTFFESVKMSTYLVAVVVSDFKTDTKLWNDIEIGVCSRANAYKQAEYALSVMSPLVDFFEKNLKLKYQLPKLHMFALPDFPSGAMENWGLLTYKETNMLYDVNHSPITNKKRIRNVIGHEISHQWFGNLVSPKWWNYLWLNEGFARYFQYHASAIVFNDTSEEEFVVEQVHSALKSDSSRSTHAMSHDVYSPSEIRSIFDSISYAKGASVLRMIEKSYGRKLFYEALHNYLNQTQYDVATPNDLYKSLQTQITKTGSEDNIKIILDTWTTQPGYPIVHVKVNEETKKLNLRQERFFLKRRKDNSKDSTTWHIPITLGSFNEESYLNTTPKLWLKKENETFPLDPPVAILNVQQSGFYRVNYEKDHWLKLIDHLKSENFASIHLINRAALIDDIMNLARAGYVDYRTVILATTYLKQEKDYIPWRAFYNNLPYLSDRFRGRDIEGLYKKYLTWLIEPLYSRLNFTDQKEDDDKTIMLRIYTRQWACKLNIADCRFHAAKYFLEKTRRSNPIPPNYRDVVYCTAMRTDTTKSAYNFLWKEYLKSPVTTDKLVILSSLACSRNKEVLRELLLTAATENTPIRFQDSESVFSNVYDASITGVEVVMEVIKNHYDLIHQRFGGTKIKSMMNSLASRLSTYDLYQQYRSLFDWLIKIEPTFNQSYSTYLSKAEYEFGWYEVNAPQIFEALDTLLPDSSYRLPNTLYPELYNISLTPNIENGTFDGSVQIYMRVERNTTSAVLNAQNLNIRNVAVYRNYNKAKKISLSKHVSDLTTQQLKIYLNEFVNADRIIIEIEFSGILNDNMQGFYRSSYVDGNKVTRWIATTHFEPTYARQAFPCFDEPAFKSKFTINIQRPMKYKTLSNMPLRETSSRQNSAWDKFHTTTEVMSTYLVAFVVSEFESSEENGLVKIWGRPEIKKDGEFALKLAGSLVDELQKFTDIKYSFPKLDLVGIPDFKMGAMENWGLVTFRERGLFYNKDETPVTHKKSIINTVAHELVHMWFGNLVTCQWWEYIWLNEGFAQYLQWVAADLVLPDYEFMNEFVVYELHPALFKDSSNSTHPMTNPVKTPEEIDKVFDYVTYGKSSSVLRMIFNAFPKEIYIKALRDYLKRYQRGTATPTDLWKTFEPHTSKWLAVSIEDVMNTWTNQPGYPVVHAKLNDSTLTLTQERFLLNRIGNNVKSAEFYWVPIHVVSSQAPKTQIELNNYIWLGPEAKTMYINPNNEWFVVNYKQTGFYRVNYDTASWQRLISELNSDRFESIHVLNRAQIVDDLFNLARAVYVNYGLLMNATYYMSRETSHIPWRAFINGLSYVYERFEGQYYRAHLARHVLNLTSNAYVKVGFQDRQNDTHMDELQREMILRWACKINKPECIQESKKLFATWRNDTSKRITRNARAAVYCTAIRNGTSDDWNFLWDQYLKTNFASERSVIINALGCSTNKTVLLKYLKGAIDPKKNDIRKQDISAVFSAVYSANQIGVSAVINFLINNMKELYTYFNNWDDIGKLFYNTATHVSLWEQYLELVAFHEKAANEFPEIKEKLNSAVDTAKNNLAWYIVHGKTIGIWLESKEPKKVPDSSSAIAPLNIIFITIIALIPYFLNRH